MGQDINGWAAELSGGDWPEGLFCDWCLVRTENLCVRYISALMALGDLYYRAEEYAAALQCYSRLRLKDPYQKRAYRQAMNCYVRMGDRASAIRKYQECVETLREGLGLDPIAETEELYQQIIE
jgi:LuxR family maltose regulon positive regulatory protein